MPDLCMLACRFAFMQLLAKNKVVGIVLSGGPHSVYESGAPHVHAEVWKMIEAQQIPVLGICYGMQEIAHVFGGKVMIMIWKPAHDADADCLCRLRRVQ